MQNALGLARQGLGRVAPNPSVGCVIVSGSGDILASARTQDGGRPHAEAAAFDILHARFGARVDEVLQGASLYVTLEPCAHYGQTPPCAQLIADSNVARVVIAAQDPDPRVSGKGIEILKAAGKVVEYGLLADEALEINKGFFLRFDQDLPRPLVSLKIAATMDGKIATVTGDSQWITSPEARAYGHLLRLQHDGIVIGKNTLLSDNPRLNCRFGGVELDDEYAHPVPIIMNRGGQVAQALQMHRFVRKPILVTDEKPDVMPAQSMMFDHLPCGTDILGMLKALAQEHGMTRIIVEGGAQVIGAFLKSGLWDRLYFFQAPSFIGGDGLDGVSSLEIKLLKDKVDFRNKEKIMLGDNMLHVFEKKLGILGEKG